MAPNSRFDREVTGGDDRYYHLVLLAENNEGYANLMKIVSKGLSRAIITGPVWTRSFCASIMKGSLL